jgi:hypothetical protein
MFKLYFLTSVADVVASITLNYQLIQNSLEFENLIHLHYFRYTYKISFLYFRIMYIEFQSFSSHDLFYNTLLQIDNLSCNVKDFNLTLLLHFEKKISKNCTNYWNTASFCA